MVNKNGDGMPMWFDFAKVRVGCTGNDMNPYQLYNTYSLGIISNNNVTVDTVVLPLHNSNVQSELYHILRGRC